MSTAAGWQSRVRRGYVDFDQGQLHYRRAGDPAAPTIVLLHQTPSHSAMYEPLMLQLCGHYQLLALDTPGFGNSSPLPGAFDIAAIAKVFATAVVEMGIRRCHWFGHHTGAALALQVAADYPDQVERLALSGPCLLSEELRQRLPLLAPPLPIEADGQHLIRLWSRIAAKDTEAPATLCQREVLAAAAAGDAYPQAYRAVAALDTERQLCELRCPTLVLAGTEDPLFSCVEPAFRLLTNGRRAQIEGARTYVCERQPGQVAALLDHFFREGR